MNGRLEPEQGDEGRQREPRGPPSPPAIREHHDTGGEQEQDDTEPDSRRVPKERVRMVHVDR
jgi:hypothetical protein